jgi:hypothetical protein
MNSSIKPRPRTSAVEALQVVAVQAPLLPPATLEERDNTTTLNLRVKESTVTAIAQEAKARGLTIKQLVMQGVESLGVSVAATDLEDRTPRRKSVRSSS